MIGNFNISEMNEKAIQDANSKSIAKMHNDGKEIDTVYKTVWHQNDSTMSIAVINNLREGWNIYRYVFCHSGKVVMIEGNCIDRQYLKTIDDAKDYFKTIFNNFSNSIK